jgi:hypothetical protein
MPDDPVFDDGSQVVFVTPEEDPPRSGEWVDQEDMILTPTDDEVAAGEFLGQAIDIDDDEDNGSQWGTIENPTMHPEDFA